MKSILLFAVGLAALALTGCSTFKKEWETALKNPAPKDSIEGPWTGEWRSDKNNHHGMLRAVVTKTSDTTYRAHYRARFWKVFRYTYLATLSGHETNGIVQLKGDADLGFLAGGLYKYEGTANPTNFSSTYSCKWDHGKYQMTRP